MEPVTSDVNKPVDSTLEAFSLSPAPMSLAMRLPQPTAMNEPSIIIIISSDAFTLTAAVACVPSELTKYVSAKL